MIGSSEWESAHAADDPAAVGRRVADALNAAHERHAAVTERNVAAVRAMPLPAPALELPTMIANIRRRWRRPILRVVV